MVKYSIAYKDESFLMKIINIILFFNKDFMTQFTTTIGSTIYFPSRKWVDVRPLSSKVILLHELIHISDAEKYSKILFGILYLSPAILSLFAIPLMVFHWWLGLIWLILCLSPVPAYFRMKFELKAYTFSIYALYQLNKKNNYNIKFEQQIQFFTDQFTSSAYYYMWPFGNSIKNHLNAAYSRFQIGDRPFYEPEYYDMIDYLIQNNIKV